MAEPLRKRGRRPRAGGAGRGARGARGGRGRRPRTQRSPARRTLDSVLVDLVSESDEDIVEVEAARGAADPPEVPLPEPPVPAAPRGDSDSDSEGADARPDDAPRAPVRRRRRLLLDPGEAPAVPVYSGKVKSSLHLIPDHLPLLKLCPPGTEEDCVVLASSPEATETSQVLQLRVQGKEKHQMLEVSLSPDSPLKTLMCRYEEAMGLSGHKLSFFFDGTKLSGKERPTDLGMESGDLIEVWG
ncbi:NFATC2-interacting protein isoform X5 [Talpa occidentalis]|uniref:NFATC2-interacting protein isoform X5 n=1 Tax=Talpa occidentalis TaxID=50954 RepID=UPI0023F811FA|nr:NFATC2-interacting protein isoform X5 [Talpa occidentalis]